ncbi:MAG: hypothetical protein V1797_05175 [Pseudomonadota bacterium]
MFIEGMLENDQPIVLDAANNVFVGPNGYFKLVIDKIASDKVVAWHVEDQAGNRTGNLAARAKGKHVDLLINKNCRTVSHFMGRINLKLVSELQAQVQALQTELDKQSK